MKRINKFASMLIAAALMFTFSAPAAEATFYDKSSKQAASVTDSVLINGTAVTFSAYNIENKYYYKLRDFAKALSGSSKQCELQWSDAKGGILLTANLAYTPVGGELTVSDGATKTATPNSIMVYKDIRVFTLDAYSVDGTNYLKLTDLARLFNTEITWGKSTSINTNGSYFGINQTILSKHSKAEKVMVGDVLLPVVDKTVRKEYLNVYPKIQSGEIKGTVGEYGEIYFYRHFNYGSGFDNDAVIYPNGYLDQGRGVWSRFLISAIEDKSILHSQLSGGIKQLYDAGVCRDWKAFEEPIDLIYIGDYCVNIEYPSVIRSEVAIKLGMLNHDSLSDHAKDWISKGYLVNQYLDSKVYKCFEWIPLKDAIKYGYITYDQLGEDSKKHLDDADYNYETGNTSWLA